MRATDLAVRAVAHAEFLTRADESAIYHWQELDGYLRANDLDLRHLACIDLTFCLTAVAFVGTRFEFVNEDARDAEGGAVIEIVAADAETVIDFVAWPTDNPAKFATLLGVADALGEESVENPATYFDGQALRVWRTPLRWLQSGCKGVVVLNSARAPRWLAAAPGRIAGENIDLADALGGGS
jgi:hypothetical protein